MKINKVKLQNFRSFEQAEFSLHPKLNVFAGVNASGKSTVLEAIEMLLGRLTREAGQYNLNPEIKWSDVTNGKKPEECFLGIEINAGLENDEFADNQGFTSYGIRHNKEKGEWSPSLDFSRELKKRIDENQELSVLLSFMLERGKVRDFDGSRWRNPIYQNIWSCSIQNNQEFVNWFELEENVENERRLGDEPDFRSPLLENVRKAIEIFMSNVTDSGVKFYHMRSRRIKVGVNDFASEYIPTLLLKKDGEAFDLSQLSSGEKSLIVLVSEIARRASMTNRKEDALACSGIVLIDEIDLHLHPRWQRNILPALCNTFPNIQFIVTSHSPQVISSVQEGSLFLLNEGKVYLPSVWPYGYDSNSILTEVMQSTAMPSEVESKIENLFEMLKSEEWMSAEEEIQKIVAQHISPEHPDLMRAKAIFQRKKILAGS